MTPQEDDRSALARGLAQAQMGFQLVAAMVGLGAIGFFADRRFGTRPWLTLRASSRGPSEGW